MKTAARRKCYAAHAKEAQIDERWQPRKNAENAAVKAQHSARFDAQKKEEESDGKHYATHEHMRVLPSAGDAMPHAKIDIRSIMRRRGKMLLANPGRDDDAQRRHYFRCCKTPMREAKMRYYAARNKTMLSDERSADGARDPIHVRPPRQPPERAHGAQR